MLFFHHQHRHKRWTEETYFYSNVASGQHVACPSGKMSGKDVNVGEQKGYRDGFNADGSKDEDMMGILNNKNYDGNGGPQITAGMINAQYGVETVLMAVLASVIFSLFVGFITGYFCGRRCHKDEDDNLPYPDTEYEYFEQRQNINR